MVERWIARGSVSTMAEVLAELKQRVLQVQVSQAYRLVLSMLVSTLMSTPAPRGSVAPASPVIFDVLAIARGVSVTRPVVLSSVHLELPSWLP